MRSVRKPARRAKRPTAPQAPVEPVRARRHSTTPPAIEREPEPVRDYGTAARAGAVAPSNGKLVFFRREGFQYHEVEARYGRVVVLKGDPRRNEQLCRLGYLKEFERSIYGEPLKCGRCDARFIDDQTLHGHAAKDHGPRRAKHVPSRLEIEALAREMVMHEHPNLSAEAVSEKVTNLVEDFEAKQGEEEDQAIEREVAQMDRQAPIYYDRTQATLEG